ncbi:hypothetical protein OZN62_08170 [Aurantiacibacter sp. MUD11]|uniref:hypothetical protein n=1 Tax=Aurantiacibacter sp. MUD11 TaxID=3003265 RepID=UPI0022AAC450|nr:hypothetical protein [Aurantiacibacter sp. MUD11]WAT16915.1 hypothetical protein OZN62_08170 [Aurantiacibacter sp. MUD11]
MDERTLTISIVVVGAVLAIANVWRGAMLTKAGDKQRASKHMMLGAAMLMLMVVALLMQQQG